MLGLARSYGDAKMWAADVTALAGVSFRESLWAGWLPNNYGESSIFPGLTILTLAILAMCGGRDRARPTTNGTSWSRRLLAIAAVMIAIVVARVWVGPAGWPLFAFRPYRAFTLAIVLLIASLFATEGFRAAWSRRDVRTFYAVAAVFLWLLALGPEPTWLGHRLLTYGPYRLFFELHAPVVVRVSARAWLVVLPCLAVLAAFGTTWLLDRLPHRRHLITAGLAALIVAECWFVEGTVAVPEIGRAHV